MATDKGWKMPKVSIGDTVLWFPGGDPGTESSPAIVTCVGAEALAVSLVPKDGMTLVPKDAVRHLTDPKLKTIEVREQGGWDYTPSSRLSNDAASQIEDILEMIKDDKSGPGKPMPIRMPQPGDKPK